LGGCVGVASIFAAVLALARAADYHADSCGIAGPILPVLLLDIVIHSVIDLVMLVAAYLCRCCSYRRAFGGSAQALAAAVIAAAGRCAARGGAGLGLAGGDIALDLLLVLSLQGRHGLRLRERQAEQQ
jgi:hypothetical protein